MLIAIDTETNGTRFYGPHRASPFFVTISFENGTTTYYEWAVDPLTREPAVVESDLDEILDIIAKASVVVGQNLKFDYHALAAICDIDSVWDWAKVEDTLVASHVLKSKLPHDLTSLGLQYLGHDIKPHEDHLRDVVNEARRIARRDHPEWRIADTEDEYIPEFKNATDKWRYDMWLPRAVALADTDYDEKDYDRDEFLTALARYSNEDSGILLPLWLGGGPYGGMKRELEQEGLTGYYRQGMKVIPALARMEDRGVTLNLGVSGGMQAQYREEAVECEERCLAVAKSFDYPLVLPKAGANNKSLTEFVFGEEYLNLSVVERTEKGSPSLNKEAMKFWSASLPERSLGAIFIRSLNTKRSRDKAVEYLSSYERLGIPASSDVTVLHPSYNLTGTDTTRLSCSNPNGQNVGTQAETPLRRCFCPSEGREWWSMDAANIELRIPAYEAGEKDLIEVFDHPERGPYYGSYHLFVFDILHPEKFAKYGKRVKDDDNPEFQWYKKTKNFNFCKQYGGQKRLADATAGVPGTFDLVGKRCPKISALNDRLMKEAKRLGYVETIPDRTINPRRGYPLMVSRSEDWRVVPTTPLSYHVSGTAGEWMRAAIVKCDEQLYRWRQSGEVDAYMILTVHDELVFDMERSVVGDDGKPSNLGYAISLKNLMASCGDGIGIPTPVDVSYHPETWAVGISF